MHIISLSSVLGRKIQLNSTHHRSDFSQKEELDHDREGGREKKGERGRERDTERERERERENMVKLVMFTYIIK
jgi:hypothetical protein